MSDWNPGLLTKVWFFRTGISETYLLQHFFALFFLMFVLGLLFLHLSVLFRPHIPVCIRLMFSNTTLSFQVTSYQASSDGRRWHWPNWWKGKSVRGDLINLIYYFSPSWNLLSIKNDLVKRFYIYFMMVWKWWLGGKNPEKVKILIFWRVRSSTRFDDIF